MPNTWFEDNSIQLPLAVAGVVGAGVSLLVQPPKENVGIFGRLSSLTVGGATSMYLTPALAEYLKFSSAATNGTAFVLGLVSMSLCLGILNYWREFVKNPFQFIRGLRERGQKENKK